MEPLIDVVLAAYNAASTLEGSIASIQAQTERRIRIIVVNDGSTDGTRRIAERMAADDDRILVLNQENRGLVDALNEGLRHATGEFIARHDADDLSHPDRFAKQLAYFAANTDCVASSGAYQHIDTAGLPLGRISVLPAPENADVERIPQLEPYLSHPFLMVRRTAIEAIGGYRHVIFAEDTDLYWRLRRVGRLHNMSDVLGYYRIHTHSITGSSVLNGRISAVNSQRAGLSERRRGQGRQDIDFARALLDQYKKAATLESIIEVGSRDLLPDEAQRLAISTCAKLIELSGHRNYELERDDCVTINKYLVPALPQLPQSSRSYCSQIISSTAARLASKGKLAEARLLAPLPLYPSAAAKLALRVFMPSTLRQRLRETAREAGFVR